MAFILESMGLELFGAVVAAIFTVYIYLKYGVYNYWNTRGVVQEKPTVPFGNLWSTLIGRMSIGEHFANAYSKFKHHRYLGVYSFLKPSLVIADPDLIRYVLTKDFHHFHDRGMYCNTKIDPLSGHLFLLPGKQWKNLRSKLSPTFTSGKIKNMFTTVVECGDVLTSILQEKAKAGDAIEIKDFLARFSTDVIAATAFGIQCNSLTNPNAEFRYWGSRILPSSSIKNCIALFASSLMDWFSIPTVDKNISKFFIKAFNEAVACRRANAVLKNDFLGLVMQLMNVGYVEDEQNKSTVSEKSAGKISDLEGAAQALAFFLGGFETSSSTATHCLYELAIHQDIQEKVREDIDEGLKKSKGLTYESLSSMPYLNKVVSEAMRKYPSIPILNRVCTEDYEVPTTDLHITKGTPIVISVLGLHRDPDIYPDPEKFDPERFNEENIASRHPYVYIPFGGGPRSCIGVRFGLVQMKVALISLLSKYRFKLAPDTKVPLEPDRGSIVLTPKAGMHLIIELR